jgi:molybdenum cofactor cytidylyltransferase
MVLPAIALAGGESSRIGTPKALLRAGDETFIGRILSTLVAAGIDDLVVVTGPHDAEIRAELERWRERAGPRAGGADTHAGGCAARDVSLRVVRNTAEAADQLSSLRRGLSLLDHPGLMGVLVTLVDHPFVGPSTVRALLARFDEMHAPPVVRPRCSGRYGHPVVFGREALARLLAPHAPPSAKAVVSEFAARQHVVDVDDEGVWTDVDTPGDYEAAIRRFGG